MSYKLIRIDDRLIHGQVVAVWKRSLAIDRIWVIDEVTSNDDFLVGVMKLVAPADTEIVITGENHIEELAGKFDQDSVNTLVLAKYPYVMKKLFDTGISFKKLNIGGIGAAPNRKQIYQNISVSYEEEKTLRSIRDMGVDVYFQVTPDGRVVSFN